MMTIHSSQQRGVRTQQQQHVPDDVVSECNCTVVSSFPSLLLALYISLEVKVRFCCNILNIMSKFLSAYSGLWFISKIFAS